MNKNRLTAMLAAILTILIMPIPAFADAIVEPEGDPTVSLLLAVLLAASLAAASSVLILILSKTRPVKK